jgi:tetratricopeptide (TPR) repeat protein
VSTLAEALRLLSREEVVEGRAALLAVVEADPGNADAWAYLSGAHLGLGEVEAAQDASARALDLGPDRFAPLLKAGELSFRLGDLVAAEAWFLAALRSVEPGSREAAAAKDDLVIVRRRLRSSITHGAVLPRIRLPFARFRLREKLLEGTR